MRGPDGVQGAQGDRRRPHMRSEAQRSTANERFSCRARNRGVAVGGKAFPSSSCLAPTCCGQTELGTHLDGHWVALLN
jgi:hypothetical protein